MRNQYLNWFGGFWLTFLGCVSVSLDLDKLLRNSLDCRNKSSNKSTPVNKIQQKKEQKKKMEEEQKYYCASCGKEEFMRLHRNFSRKRKCPIRNSLLQILQFLKMLLQLPNLFDFQSHCWQWMEKKLQKPVQLWSQEKSGFKQSEKSSSWFHLSRRI